jgi:hypothetical protein
MQHVAGGSRSVLYLHKETDLPLLDDRHLLVGMIVFRCYQKWLEAKAADHHSITDEHLPLNTFRHLLDWDSRPVQVLR